MASLTHRMKQEDLPPLSSGLMAFSNENSNASPALDEIGRQPRQPVMLPAQPLTYELTNHAVSYIEASQYASGYSFLSTLLTTGISISTPAKPYQAFLAPAPQLALAATLIVYPAVTTKTRSADKVKGADAALRYLRQVHTIIDPLHESIRSALAFPEELLRRRDAGALTGTSPGSADSNERLSNLAANAQALWYRADDFWHAVGWAFNCSVAHTARWGRWKLWLHIMLDFVESEWKVRSKLSRQEGAKKEEVLKESLLWHYISSREPTHRPNRRRMVKAILAMATPQSNMEFTEVWNDETAEPKQVQEDDKYDGNIDIEGGHFGEFQRNEEDEVMEQASTTSLRTSRTRSGKKSHEESSTSSLENDELIVQDPQAALDRLGGIEALHLRQRLITLLTQAAEALPQHFTSLSELFDRFTEELLPLPVMVFSHLLSTSELPGVLQCALNANHLIPLTMGKLPDFTIIAPDQATLETYLLPKRATTQAYVANAKVSLILEQTFMQMMKELALKPTDSLRTTVEQGIQERTQVFGTGRVKKGNSEEEAIAQKVLEASSDRLLGLLEMLEIAAGKPSELARAASRKLNIPMLSSLSSLSSPPGSDTELDD